MALGSFAKSNLAAVAKHQNHQKIKARGSMSFERANIEDRRGKFSRQYKILQGNLPKHIPIFAFQNRVWIIPSCLAVAESNTKGFKRKIFEYTAAKIFVISHITADFCLVYPKYFLA